MNLPSSCIRPFKPPTHNRFVSYVSWISPADYAWKLNFAGFIADHRTGSGGAGFILRDENAIMKAACAEPLKYAESRCATELLALSHGLQIAITQGVEYLEIEGDCSTVFQMLHGLISPPSPGMARILAKCLQYIRSFRCVKTRWVNVHRNEPTNKVAELAIAEDEPVYWFTNPPPDVMAMLIEDVIGRMVPLSDVMSE